MIADCIPTDKVAAADGLLARMGSTYRIQQWIDDIDFDPDAIMGEADRLVAIAEGLQEAEPPDCATLFMSAGLEWTGDASQIACDHLECQRSFWDHVVDFLLWLVQQIIQILDYVIDVLRVVVAWITWLAVALSLVALTIVVIATFAGVGPGVVAAVLEGPAFAILGAIALIGAAVSILLALLNVGIEAFQQVIQDARSKICGKGLPSLPEWDPTGWEPPIWPT